MRDTKKTITFDFEFKYPTGGGQYAFEHAITVCEPSWENRATYIKMQAYLAEAQRNLIKSMGSDRKAAEAEIESAESTGGAPAAEPDALVIMQLGLGIDTYPKFVDWLMRELTGKKSLAYVGADLGLTIKDRIPLTEEVWMNVADAGGLEAADKIAGAFAGFFLSGKRSSTASDGTGTPSGPVSDPTGQSGSSLH